MYVGTFNHRIIVIQNEITINFLNVSIWLSFCFNSILFDQYGYMATSCFKVNNLYLYTIDGNYTGTSLSTPWNTQYIGFDAKGHFVVISFNQISIYN
jgi:hypothetical protein